MASDDTNVAPVPKIPNTASKLVPQTKNKVLDMEVPDDRPAIENNHEMEQDSNLDKIG